jgi:hypothetical protein
MMANEPPIRDEGDTSRGPGGLSDGTLGGYFTHHARPPAFEGSDGYPYTVSVEVEKTPDLLAPFAGYLVFPRWARTGAGIIGHLETPLLTRGTSRGQVTSHLEARTLQEVRDLLEEAIKKRKQETE